MLYQCQSYNVGLYEDCLKGTLSFNGPALLASTLAWAVKNHLPLPPAVLSLTDDGTPWTSSPLFFWRRRNWNHCLKALYYDLTNGISLGQALRRRMKFFLPEFYLQGVERAERDGHLAEILPLFAQRLNLAAEIKLFRRKELLAPLLIFALILLLLTGMSVCVIPKWIRLMHELVGRCWLFQTSVLESLTIIQSAPVLILEVWLIYLFFFSWWQSLFFRLAEEVLIWLPGFRKLFFTRAILELDAAMAAYLASGADIITAARFSCAACPHFWLRRRLRRFIRDTENGLPWLDAWRRMRLPTPLGELLLANAQARGDLAAGFDTAAEWHFHELRHQINHNLLWLTLAMLGVNAALVFILAWSIFSSMSLIIKNLAG